ncbi:MAG: TolC family protein, partial [Thermosulfidibacteraceae bacterium]
SNYPPAVWMSKMARGDVTPSMMNLRGFNDPDRTSVFRSSLIMRYPVFYGFEIVSRVRAKELESQIMEEYLKLTKEDIALKTIKAYLDVCYAKSKIEASKKDVETAEKHVELAEARHKRGIALLADVLKAKVYLASAKDKLAQANTYYEVSLSRLAMLTGDDPKIKPEVNCTVEELYNKLKNYSFLDINNLVSKGLNNRKDIMMAKRETEISQERLREAKSNYYPKIDLYASYDWYGANYPFQSDKSSNTIGVVMRLNIFDGFAREKQIKASELAILRSKELLSSKEKEAATEIIGNVLKIKEAIERINLAQSAVREAEETLRTLEARYKEGLSTITELTDSQAYLFNARSNLIGAYYDYVYSVYQTEFSTGTLLEFLGLK